jgi:maltooligosyltrehalose trehalohydrolase
MNPPSQPRATPADQGCLGANYMGNGRCSFLVWAPFAKRLDVRFTAPEERSVPLQKTDSGYFHAIVENVRPGARYLYKFDTGTERPDPASRFQPEGVHAASAVIDPSFEWRDHAWSGLPLRDYIFYELHVGTFTREGTFDAIIPHLPGLRDLGITAIELMPVAQFPGERNWGYDGVLPFAVQNSYGGPAGLKRLVNACHEAGLAVVLDVVYNHFGPEGNYLREFGPYFTDSYKTLWGAALNFDGADSDPVRRFFIENALYWQREFHMDALRLDAVHAIRDTSAVPFLQELARAARRQSERLNRQLHLIAESDLNDARLVLPEETGGYGLHAQWSDDFHHCLHVLLTRERDGYYSDFGGTELLAKVFREGYAYTGEYSGHRRRRHGNSPRLLSAKQFVVYSQNHDQIGNRLLGDRLSRLTDFEALKLAAGCVLLSPFLPLLFMGEEYGEPAPFQYIISHTDPALVEAVRRGRAEEFAGFKSHGSAPDPQAEATFMECKLNRDLPRKREQHRRLHDWYRELIRLRKEQPALRNADKENLQARAWGTEQVLAVQYHWENDAVWAIYCFVARATRVELDIGAGRWDKILDSAEQRWNGTGSRVPAELQAAGRITLELNPKSVVVFGKASQD